MLGSVWGRLGLGVFTVIAMLTMGSNALAQSCGDGATASGEACDDGNTSSNDGCSSSCTTETGWSCACATPTFTYSQEAQAGRIGGAGGSVGPEMQCSGKDILIGLAINWSNGTGTATRTRTICGQVAINASGTVTTTQTTTEESGGNGAYGWDPSTWSTNVTCPSGSAIVGLRGQRSGSAGSLFTELSIVCQTIGVDGSAAGPKTVLEIPGGTDSGGPAQSVDCPTGRIARFFQTRAGAGQDALDLYCGVAATTCAGQQSACGTLCGDGVVGAPREACDDGGATPSCNSDCTVSSCGDGKINSAAGETCDDSGESAACDADCTLATCGDGTLNVTAGEFCDGQDGCNAQCKRTEGVACTADEQCASNICDTTPGQDDCERADTCGNGRQESGEACDDGNAVGGDGCSAGCLLEVSTTCGNDGACASGVCTDTGGGSACRAADECGNGRVEAAQGEGCDDGNTDDADGCDSNCKLEDGEACDASAKCASGVCDLLDSNTCEAADTCGNGIREGAEVCDDGNTAVDGNGCDAACKLPAGTPCSASDQCGAGLVCDTLGSRTCEAEDVCGNGVVDGVSEACDDGNMATGDGCDGSCLLETGAGCSSTSDCTTGDVCDLVGGFDCEPENTCGNGVVETGESCDDGNTADDDDCDSSCDKTIGVRCGADDECASLVCNLPGGGLCATADACGNGKVEGVEGCDDGNTADGDGCDSSCDKELAAPCTADDECGSGVCNTAINGTNACALPATCGNGKLEPFEACDDGDRAPGGGCSLTCQLEDGESCTLSSECLSFACASSGACVRRGTCGNGFIDLGEWCDDGNVADGDGCSAGCLLEDGDACTSSSQCVGVCNRALGATAAVCAPANTCGNGTVEAGELCDDGNTTDGDACDALCRSNVGGPCASSADCSSGYCNLTLRECVGDGVCGNGVVEDGEGCDDANLLPRDGCFVCRVELGASCARTSDCLGGVCNPVAGVCATAEVCGNGVVEAPEACDDGNLAGGDGCAPDCTDEPQGSAGAAGSASGGAGGAPTGGASTGGAPTSGGMGGGGGMNSAGSGVDSALGADSGDDGGCGCGVVGQPRSPWAAAVLGLLGAAIFVRRRRLRS